MGGNVKLTENLMAPGCKCPISSAESIFARGPSMKVKPEYHFDHRSCHKFKEILPLFQTQQICQTPNYSWSTTSTIKVLHQLHLLLSSYSTAAHGWTPILQTNLMSYKTGLPTKLFTQQFQENSAKPRTKQIFYKKQQIKLSLPSTFSHQTIQLHPLQSNKSWTILALAMSFSLSHILRQMLQDLRAF